MHPTLQMVEQVEELLLRQSDKTPYDYKTLFPMDGFWVRRASQKRLKLLKRIDQPLRDLIKPGERVLFLSSGVLYSFWESYLFGLPMYYLNRRALVLTNERLILLQIDSSRKPRELRSHILLRGIDKFDRTGLGSTVIRLKSGKKYTIAYVPRRDRKALVEMIKGAQSSATRESAAGTLEHLCPHCYVPLDGHPLQCAECGGSLKSAKKAGLLSLIFPGIGDIYLGHWRFAILEILIATLVWVGLLLPDPETPVTTSELLVAALLVFIIVHGSDAFSTWYVARRGHYPGHASPGRPVTAGRAA